MDETGLGTELGRAVRDGRADVDDVALVVGASAASAGLALHEVIDLVEGAYDGRPDHATVRAACVGWADVVLHQVHGAGCEDVLTSLAPVPHLRSHLDGVYREAAHSGRRPADTHVLVVVEAVDRFRRHRLEESLAALEVAEALRTVFPGEEVLAELAPGRFGAVATRERADAPALALLGLLLARTCVGRPAPRLWAEELPDRSDDLTRVLAQLGR